MASETNDNVTRDESNLSKWKSVKIRLHDKKTSGGTNEFDRIMEEVRQITRGSPSDLQLEDIQHNRDPQSEIHLNQTENEVFHKIVSELNADMDNLMNENEDDNQFRQPFFASLVRLRSEIDIITQVHIYALPHLESLELKE